MKVTRLRSLKKHGPGFGKTAEAFTLIELLTVIAIIGILAAILIPVASSVRATAQQATCASNLRAVALAAHVFADDHNGAFHGYVIANFEAGNSSNSPSAPSPGLAHYLDLPLHPRVAGNVPPMTTVLTCPTSQMLRPSSDHALRTYTINREATSDHRSPSAIFSTLSQVENPTRMAYLMDGAPLSESAAGWYYGLAGRSNYIPNFIWPHKGSQNVVFLDGHVETLGPEFFTQYASGDTTTFWIGR